MKDIKKIECYSLSGMAILGGFIKNGLDSSIIINLITVFDSEFDEFKKRGFAFPPNLFYYHEISYGETVGILINKFKFSKNEAYKAVNKLISKFNLTKIRRISLVDEQYEKLVEEANNRVVKKFNNPRLKIGEQDIIIMGGFMRNKINFVHSGDIGFLKTCEELKINILPMPKKDIEKEDKIKRWMKDGRK